MGVVDAYPFLSRVIDILLTTINEFSGYFPLRMDWFYICFCYSVDT